jgi:sugar-specific transcriptional regulator TrmB
MTSLKSREAMADDIDILEKVKSLGLNSYEAKVYLALFERESLSVNEIAKISNVPRARIYDTLDSLMNEGLASLKPGRLKKYSAAAPELLQQKLERKIETQYKSQKETLASTVLTLKRTYEARRENGFDDSNPLEYIEVLKNPNHIHAKFLELFPRAQEEVLAFVKSPYTCVTQKQVQEQQRVQDEAARRGVIRKAIFELPPGEGAIEFARNAYVKRRVNSGKVRFADELPIKLFVFDKKTCFFAFEDPIKEKTSLTMLVTEHKAMAKSFTLLFDSIWKDARDYFVVNDKKYYIDDLANTQGDDVDNKEELM